MFHVEQRIPKPTRLTDNISSELISAAAMMHRSGVVMVYVEGYDDISFWRSILDDYETKDRKFEVSTPVRADLAKGKKVVLNFAPQSGEHLLLCVDSDFDHLFGDYTDQSRLVNGNPHIIQTYVYAIENFLCYPPSLHSLAVKATKNDTRIFDFESFMREYSKTIYPVFLWYIYAAKSNNPGLFTLNDFRNTVKINYLNPEDDGIQTLEWLRRQIQKRSRILTERNPEYTQEVAKMGKELTGKGVTPETTHLYMQGHTLMDYVVKTVLAAVCDALRKQWVDRIMQSSREGLTLRNELSYYNNSLRDIDSLLMDNTLFHECHQFKKVEADLEAIFGKPKVKQ